VANSRARHTPAIFGVDFTSAPSRRKPIVAAVGEMAQSTLVVRTIEALPDFAAFDALLARTGPWVAAFDLPLGLPRALVATLGWPQQWRDMLNHVNELGKPAFKLALDAVRQSRPMGSRYIARQGDAVAGSSSPMKLVNPPVGLMFFEGAIRIARSGASVVPCASNASDRVALEAYPGFLARQITSGSYKKEGRDPRATERRTEREMIIDAVLGAREPHASLKGLQVMLPEILRNQCVDDGSGDALDAVLCAAQAAMSWRAFDRGDENYGIPADTDPLEGWIATVARP
jgi:Protein of unknown function (DUF429)